MAITNHERVGRALDLLKAGLGSFIDREIDNALRNNRLPPQLLRPYNEDPLLKNKPIPEWDSAGLLRLMWETWNEVFRTILGRSDRSLVSEIRDHRNKWAHQETFSSDDTDRALDSMARLLTSISAPQADDINKMKMELRRLIFDEQMRNERRKTTSTTLESNTTLKPWREVVNPHPDVASGRYQQAEFAADLWQVHIGEGSPEYRDPVEFFRRTYLTDSLSQLLANALQRLSGQGGDPVVQLQTNFGGGKTHSMLALYHLLSGIPPTDLLGLEAVLQTTTITEIPRAKRVVLVGNKISPSTPNLKPDGIRVHTLWGELAYQLGGKAAYERIRADDENATSPGDALRELMNEYGPCLVLIDEWVAYARQLHDQNDLPAGNFETHFTFAQALTESAKLSPHCLLVVSLPASEASGTSPQSLGNDEEVGGERGRSALERLRNAVGRVESSWRPASAEEGFEIVRRRLFEPLTQKEQFVTRDTVARACFELYRTQPQEFPPECHDSDYEKRLKAAYPIHPEIFDRLYSDWSGLVKFQRTRGVLRLMAAVIHSLWEKGDRNPLILPAHISIDDPRVQFELTRYLSDNWVPVLEKDVDGPSALPARLDAEVPNLGKFSACRRVARTVYLGSAPTPQVANRGLEDRRIKLGCVLPGESPAVFGDALRRLATAATYLYQDGSRYWYSTQPTVTKLAEDRAEQLKRDPDAIAQELQTRLRHDLNQKGSFRRIHLLPQSSQDIPDDPEARLVVLGIDHLHHKGTDSPALAIARTIFETRGQAPRLYRNTLVFLAADQARWQDFDQAIRRYLAWNTILHEKDLLNLDPHQTKQAETQHQSAQGEILARIPETYKWLISPTQETPHTPIEWQSYPLTGTESLAVRASTRLIHEELLVTTLSGTRLRMEMDRIPLWRGNHVPIRQLLEDFTCYLYLPRLLAPSVLCQAIEDGLKLLTWEQETFAYADSYDAERNRYRGLRVEEIRTIPDTDPGLLVRPAIARQQLDSGSITGPLKKPDPIQPQQTGSSSTSTLSQYTATPTPKPKTRYYGTVELDPLRFTRDAGQIGEEVIVHLTKLVGSRVKITLEIEAEYEEGFSDSIIRTVSENGQSLKFTTQSFEEE